MNAFSDSLQSIISAFNTDVEKGLSASKVAQSTSLHGLNVIQGTKEKSRLSIFIGQLKNSIVLLLMAAVAISLAFKDYTEAIAITGVILINAIIGYILEIQAIRSMEALKRLDKSWAKVIRDGQVIEIEAQFIVPGDLLALEAGDLIAADARICKLNHLEVNESSLTGESLPVIKSKIILQPETSLADRTNMLFKGTAVTRGNAEAIVVATGGKTELGKISSMVSTAGKDEIPLNKKLEVFSHKLIWLTLAIIAPFILLAILTGRDLHVMSETAIALAVAAIPEGLPIVATIALARGMLKMAKDNVIIKKLAAVETLGETDIIMTDKTGTLTENRLSVEVATIPELDTDLIFRTETPVAKEKIPLLDYLLTVAVLCNNSTIDNQTGIGDPLEIALLKWAKTINPELFNELKSWIRIAEQPFESELRIMYTVHSHRDSNYVAVKGGPDDLLKHCSKLTFDSKTVDFGDDEKSIWLNKTKELAKKGLKVLGFAKKEFQGKHDYHDNLEFLGLIGFIDPPRPQVKEAILNCHSAGIKVFMATGDHPETAKAIAKEIGLATEDELSVWHGNDLDKIATDAYRDHINLEKSLIFSRVTPAQKLELINYFQEQGWVVGMTGDGVNDAPALRKADIGIAMGQRGTQVAEEAADMVLLDDSFTSIVNAIRYGRNIFQNIKHFVIYLLSCNLSEVLVVSVAAFSNFSLPLLPLQILFLNLVTDVFPALALGMGEGSAALMQGKPYSRKAPIVDKSDWRSILIYASVLTSFVLGVFIYANYFMPDGKQVANSIAFFTLAFSQLLHPFNLIGAKTNLLRNKITRNPHLWAAILFCICLLILAYSIPVFHELLSLRRLEIQHWMLIIAGSVFPVLIIRLLKIARLVK